MYGQHDRVMDGGLFLGPSALISLLPQGLQTRLHFFILVSPVKHNPGSCVTSSTGLHSVFFPFPLEALG